MKWKRIAPRRYASDLFTIRYEHSGRPLSLHHTSTDQGVWIIERLGKRVGIQPLLRDAKETAENYGR